MLANTSATGRSVLSRALMPHRTTTTAPRAGAAWSLAALAGTLVIGACADGSPITDVTQRVPPAAVTEQLARSLSPGGRFLLPTKMTAPRGELSEAAARAIASRYVQDMARIRSSEWSTQAGVPVNSKTLAPCDRAIHALSPYASITGSDLSEVTLRTFGPHWVIPMCENGSLRVVVAFSSLALELAGVSSSQPMPWAGSVARSFGVPIDVPSSIYAPEGATQAAFGLTKRRVSAIPEAVLPPMPGSPVLIRWKTTLEGAASVRGEHSGVVRDRQTIFVGFDDTFSQHGVFDGDPGAEAPLTAWTDPVTKSGFTVTLAAGVPGKLERVVPEAP